MPYLLNQYNAAIRIERVSQSPRITHYHDQNQHCKVGVGVLDPNTTQYLLVSINPGGNPILARPQDSQLSVAENRTFNAYLGRDHIFAHYFRQFVAAFAEAKQERIDNLIPRFGTTDLSIFYSKGIRQLARKDFQIEVSESKEILRNHLSIDNLTAIIFFFADSYLELFRAHYARANAPILNQRTFEGIPNLTIRSFSVELWNQKSVHCTVLPHPCHRKLGPRQTNQICSWLARQI